MKQIKVLLSLIFLTAVLLASTLSLNAIGFEAEETYNSVFVIYSGNSLGSGFAIGENCIVTNAHVIDNERNITVESYDGDTFKAYAIGIDNNADIAILAVKDTVFPYLEIADISTMKTGDDIYAVGAPKGMAYTLTKGGISAKERIIDDKSYIQIDAAINEGNSGGPLLNDNGRVLGMNTLKMNDSEGIGLAIPISQICIYLESLGIELDTNNNVVGKILVSQESQTIISDTPDTEKSDVKKTNNSPLAFYIAIFVAILSIIANVVLTCLLVKQKKLTATLKFDPTERTDFEIDILE